MLHHNVIILDNDRIKKFNSQTDAITQLNHNIMYPHSDPRSYYHPPLISCLNNALLQLPIEV